jgi:hypothetical protein
VNSGDRRRHPRRAVPASARAASRAEQSLARGEVVDLSVGGVLLRFDEQHHAVFHDDHVLVTLEAEGASLHLLGAVRRFVRGSDDAFYLAVEFEHVDDDDQRLLRSLVERSGERHRQAPAQTRWHPSRAQGPIG